MTEDVFKPGDPFDDPNWDGTARAVSRVKHLKLTGRIGCPAAWLHAVWPHVQSKEQLAVALLLYRHRHLYRGKPFAFSNVETGALGISKKAKRGALANLEGAGLIKVERFDGRAPLITVLDYEKETPTREGSNTLSVSIITREQENKETGKHGNSGTGIAGEAEEHE